jgi:Mitochondrial domain of unknown function (DUF1713).
MSLTHSLTMSFTALRSSSLTTFKSTTNETTNLIVSSFENTSWKSLVSILQEASISLFSNHEQKTNKESQNVPSSSSISSGIAYAPWMRYNEYKHHDILSSSKYPCPISIHGMSIQSLRASCAVESQEGNSYNLSLFQLPIELDSDHVAHDAEDDDHGIAMDDDGKSCIQDESKNNGIIQDLSTWLISTLKRRKKKMNKHKLRKRRKLERLKSKK